MDLLDSILSSMDKPPSVSETQKNAMRKQKEAIESKQKEEKAKLTSFKKTVEEKLTMFVEDPTLPSYQFEPMDQRYRSIIREVADVAGLQVYSFGEEGIDRYAIVYKKDQGPCEDEITVRKSGDAWNAEKAIEMILHKKQMLREHEREQEEQRLSKKRGQEVISGAFYKQKYAHLIGEDAALDAAKKTVTNESYGEVPSENKKDLRSIEQTMADIKEKKRRKLESEAHSNA